MGGVRQRRGYWAVVFAPLGVVLAAVLVSCGPGESSIPGFAPSSAPQFAAETVTYLPGPDFQRSVTAHKD